MKITVTIDDEIVRKVHEIAADKNTTLTAMVREYLASVANSETTAPNAASGAEGAERLRDHIASIINRDSAGRDTAAGEEAVNMLRESWDQFSRPMGPRDWTRDDLYDRPHAYFKRD